MKKVLLTPTLFILFSICSLNAQTTFGVKGGLNLASINIDNSDMILTWQAGAFSHMPLGGKVFFQPELLISRKGTRLKDFFYTSDLTFNIVYLSMPLVMGVEAGPNLVIGWPGNLKLRTRSPTKTRNIKATGTLASMLE